MIAQLFSAIPAAKAGSFWLPEDASTVAQSVDSAWAFVYWVSLFFFVLIMAILIAFLIKYRRRKGHEAELTTTHHYPLELTWSILPTFIIVVMFVMGVNGFVNMRTPPDNTYDIEVIAQKWSWTFIYPNGIISPELHVPVDRDVKLIMSSEDVIHSLFIPVFRVKQDILPGRYNYLWFNATRTTEEGEAFDLYCTEYCGRNHSEMVANVYVHEEADLEKWFADEIIKMDSMPPIELGEKLYNERGCAQCHATTDERRVGPGFAQTYGVDHPMADGATIKGDENYIQESILNPLAHVRAGYPGTMPTYKGLLRDAEVRGLVAYIKSLNPEYTEEAKKQYAKPVKEQGEDTAEEEAEAGASGDPAVGESFPGSEGGDPSQPRE